MNGQEMESICFQFINISREIFHMLYMEEVICSLPAVHSRWAMSKWHLEVLGCVTSQSSLEILIGGKFDTASLFSADGDKLFSLIEGREKAKDVHSMAVVTGTGCHCLSFVFKIWAFSRSSTNHHTDGRIIWGSREFQAGTANRAVGGESVGSRSG